MELDELDNHIELFDSLLGSQAANRESRFDYQLGRDSRPDALRPGREFHRIEITTRNHNFNPIQFSWFYHSIDDRSKYYLTSMSLRGLGLESIDFSILNELNHLEYLDLQGNLLHSIDLLGFDIKERLHTINLSSNNLKSLNLPWGAMFPSLRTLNLASNHLTNFDFYEIGECKDLNRLNLAENELSNTNFDGLASLKYLNSLDLSDNTLESLVLIGDHPLLTSLYAHINAIDNFKLSGNFPSLRLLSLYENELREINLTDWTNCAPYLSRLYLWGNNISKVIVGNSSVNSISELKLAGNSITELAFLRQLPKLEISDLSYNQIENINITDFPQDIKAIDLTGNPIQKNFLKLQDSRIIIR
ncbi:MAG: leucine-rich repeat domain-containing protein [Candidatus Kariarchaeaceae archaeon]|jgi:Leucine-rich repeat (LRR) protein